MIFIHIHLHSGKKKIILRIAILELLEALHMWTVTKIRTDYEGWWLFEDWKNHIIETYCFDTYDSFLKNYEKLIREAKANYDNCIVGKYNMYAFYNNCDMNYCEHCDEDLQIFDSFIILNNEKIYYNLPLID